MIWFRRAKSDAGRWVVLDVEASGLDPDRDRLLAIAGVGLRAAGERPQIELADSFEVVLRHESAPADKANILLHGVGVGAQRRGVDAATALDGFAQWVGSAPCIGFHVAFDRRLIERAQKAARRPALGGDWIDLADVAAVVEPAEKARSLDEWLERFGIVCAERHQAAADTLATAELLLRLWPKVRAEGVRDAAGLVRLAAQRRWIRS